MGKLPTLDDLRKGNIKKSAKKEKEKKENNNIDTIKYNPIKARQKGYPKQKTVKEQANEDLENKSFEELIDILLNENEDIPITELLKYGSKINNASGDKKTPKTSPLEGVRKGLEDVYTIQNLKELIADNRTKKSNNNANNENISTNSSGGLDDFAAILPVLEALQKSGVDTSKIDPYTLALSLGSNRAGNNQLSSVMSLLSLTKLLTSGNQESNGHSNLNAEMFKQVYEEIKGLINQTQTQNALDPNTMIIAKALSNNNNNNNPAIDKLLMKFDQMMVNNQTNQLSEILNRQQERTELMLEKIAGMIGRDPQHELVSYFNLFNRISGDRRNKTKDEMEFAIENKKIDLEDKRLSRAEEREYHKEQIEAARSDKIIDAAKDFLAPLLAGGIGGIIGDIRGATNQSPLKKKGLNDINIPSSDYDLL